MAREDWLHTLPKGIVCAEIGVQRGIFSKRIYDVCKPSILYLIDGWQKMEVKEGNCYPYMDAHYQKLQMYMAVQRFKRAIQDGVVRPIVELSNEAVQHFPDEHLDFVYIDALHTEEACYEDVVNWTPKVKRGGIVAGHDYHLESPWGHCGVPAAVDRYVAEHKLDLQFVDDKPWKAKRRLWPTKTWWFQRP